MTLATGAYVVLRLLPSTAVSQTDPGIIYRMLDERPQYTLPDQRPIFKMPDERPQYELDR